MKLFKNVWLQFFFALALLNTTAVSAAIINLNLTGAAQAGSSFTVEVWADKLFTGLQANEELLAFGLNVANNASDLFSLTGVTIAAPFADDSALLSLDAAGSAFPGISNQLGNQSVLLASLNFFANRAGIGTIGVRSDPADFGQGLIFFQNANININADIAITVSAVPLPAALPLLLSAVVLFAGVVRRRNK